MIALPAMVPLPLVTEQVWPADPANTLTEYVSPEISAALNVNGPVPPVGISCPSASSNVSPPLFCNAIALLVANPVMVPPTV